MTVMAAAQTACFVADTHLLWQDVKLLNQQPTWKHTYEGVKANLSNRNTSVFAASMKSGAKTLLAALSIPLFIRLAADTTSTPAWVGGCVCVMAGAAALLKTGKQFVHDDLMKCGVDCTVDGYRVKIVALVTSRLGPHLPIVVRDTIINRLITMKVKNKLGDIDSVMKDLVAEHVKDKVAGGAGTLTFQKVGNAVYGTLFGA